MPHGREMKKDSPPRPGLTGCDTREATARGRLSLPAGGGHQRWQRCALPLSYTRDKDASPKKFVPLTIAQVTAIVHLTRGYHALIDASDWGLIAEYCWYAHTSVGIPYAMARLRAPQWREKVPLHRFIMGAHKGQYVDHKNRDGLDNRRSNLRICTNSQNQHNCQTNRGSSCYKGVSWQKSRRKWKATITVDGKNKHLGLFADELEAACAYDAAAREHFGEFARPNLPEAAA